MPLDSSENVLITDNSHCNFTEMDEFLPEEVKNVVKQRAIGRTTNISNFVSPKPNLELSILIGQNTKMGTPTDGIFESSKADEELKTEK